MNGGRTSFGEAGSGNASSSAGRTSPPAARATSIASATVPYGVRRSQSGAVDHVPRRTAGEALDDVALVPRRLAQVGARVVEHERVPGVELRGRDELALRHLPRHRAPVVLVHPLAEGCAQADRVVEPLARAPRVRAQQQAPLAREARGEPSGRKHLLPP